MLVKSLKYYLQNCNISPVVLYPPAKKITYYGESSLKTDLKNKLKISEHKYFLFCNVKRERKNNSVALLAFDDFLSKSGKYDFKAVALGSDKKYENYILPKLKNKSNFVFCSYLQEADFEALYKFAHLFVFPSILEGFGYPPAEAMKYGTLCACSSLTSIPEICQEAVIYFNPFDIRTIEFAYYQSFDSEITNEKKSKINSRFKELSKKQNDDFDSLIDLIIS